MKVGIYGGTFDPPHLGHMEAACAAVGHLGLDRLLLIPSKLPPHKFLPEDTAGTDHRYAMVEIMADGVGPKAQVRDLELHREGPSYTVDTVKTLRNEMPDAQFFLLMGTDMFLSFENWREAETIAKEAILVPFRRESTDSHELFAVQSERLQASLGAQITQLNLPKIHPISSTQLRHLLKAPNTRAEGGALLWDSVYGYILRHGLYGTGGDLAHLELDQLRAVSYSMIRAARIPHVQGTEETAAKLAERFGADSLMARRAAILHDCTKYWSTSEHLALCNTHSVSVGSLERKTEKMLHAISGALLAETVFHETPEVCAAIACHTTGKANMTTLDKVLYVADYIEPNRAFDGVEALRAAAFEDLDKAMLMGLETTMAELKEKNAPIHEHTKQALLSLKGS